MMAVRDVITIGLIFVDGNFLCFFCLFRPCVLNRLVLFNVLDVETTTPIYYS